MKSGTSLFNKSISLDLLKRCWPVWTCWFVVLIFMLPVSIFSGLSQAEYWVWTVARFLHGILRARMLEWIAISSSRGSSQPRD